KVDEGYLVGYSSNSKSYRVYNLTSKRVEETMNLRFMEDKPNVQGIGHEWYFDLDYLSDPLGYTRFKTDTPAGAQATNIIAGNQDDDSDSEYDEQVIVVPSFPSNSFIGPSSSNGPSVTERNADYAEELARLQRQEYEAKDAAKRYGYLFSQETAAILSQAKADIWKNDVSAALDSAGKVLSAGGILAGSDSAGSMPAGSSSSSGYPAGSTEPAGSIPAASTSVSADSIPVYAEATTLPPGQLLGSSESTTRFPVPSDQEEMQQFINQEVWKLVPLPEGKYAIGTKWILKNKRDARGIVVRNKARLVVQGHRQEEGMIMMRYLHQWPELRQSGCSWPLLLIWDS
nr:ribonuclease H-like domain-containing protein [Tanacetum cinerariifolium]